MQTRHYLLSDAARLFGAVTQIAGAVRTETDDFIAYRLQRLLNEMQVVHRDEFEAVRTIALQALAENKRLKQELNRLKKATKPS